ncbi:unnamed protein product [Effrenium voratum]|uniref:Uncharacterized protein n=1 Tax=Effrenium voratum TaxID=2562239 RepID=A0AA36JI53_9DINO|nr:unnamed protein product [Effrenium voratum]
MAETFREVGDGEPRCTETWPGSAGATRLSKEELTANAGFGEECRAKTPCYEVAEEEFERLWLSGKVEPSAEVEDSYEISEEDFERLLKAGQLQLAGNEDQAGPLGVSEFELSDLSARRPLKRPRPRGEAIATSAPKPMPPSTAPIPSRRCSEPTRPQTVCEGRKALAAYHLLERNLWSSEAMPRAAGSPARRASLGPWCR